MFASGLSCGMRDLQLWHVCFSLVVVCELSCPVACGILVPRPGIEPVSPALEGRLPATGPPGKSRHSILDIRLDIRMAVLSVFLLSTALTPEVFSWAGPVVSNHSNAINIFHIHTHIYLYTNIHEHLHTRVCT